MCACALTAVSAHVQLTDLSDLQPLVGAKALRTLSLLDNPCSRQAMYRPYVVHLLPQLRILDFRKIKAQARPPFLPLGRSLKRERAGRSQSVRMHRSGTR
jgi:hypothetical protein